MSFFDCSGVVRTSSSVRHSSGTMLIARPPSIIEKVRREPKSKSLFFGSGSFVFSSSEMSRMVLLIALRPIFLLLPVWADFPSTMKAYL